MDSSDQVVQPPRRFRIGLSVLLIGAGTLAVVPVPGRDGKLGRGLAVLGSRAVWLAAITSLALLVACLPRGDTATTIRTSNSVFGSASEGNVWPFVGASSSIIARYVDEQATAVAVNLMLGQLVIGVRGRDETIGVPLAYIDSSDIDILPVWPVAADRTAAMRKVAEWQPHGASRGLAPVVLYEGPGGLLWPTGISARTTPRIWSVYPAALEEARRSMQATGDTFVHLAFWYVGARLPIRTRPAPRTATPAAADLIEGYTVAETAIIREARTIMGSSKWATIRAAHSAGETTSVTVGGRLIQYQADFTYAEAMTLGRDGFVLGPRAFASEAEVIKTVLHELHRLHTSSIVATGAADAAAAARATRDAWTFAETAWRVVLSGAP